MRGVTDVPSLSLSSEPLHLCLMSLSHQDGWTDTRERRHTHTQSHTHARRATLPRREQEGNMQAARISELQRGMVPNVADSLCLGP